jgi:hypothetical protein
VDGRTDKWAKRVNDAYPCGTRLVRWELLDKTGREVSLSVDIPMTCWATLFSRKDADMVRWPTGPWTPVAASTFNDFQNLGTIGTGQPLVLVEHNNPVVQNLVSTWCDGKDPKTIPPVALAEWLAGNVLEMIQPNGDGLNFNDNGSLEGFQLKGAVQTILDKRGNDQDISCVVAAVYRAAGLPARIVIGYDINDKKGLNKNFLTKKTGTNTFRSWVEFCLLDEKKKTEVWVPVDVTRQRKNSNKVLNTPKSWRYFGEHDELDGILPIAFQFHPPAAGVLSHGSPCFWGWFTTPRAQVANQYLRFNGITTPRTATTDSDRAADEELEKKDEQTKKP